MPVSPTIFAVIVLYRMAADESRAYVSLQRAVKEPEFAKRIDFMLCDNTPYEQPAPAEFGGEYMRDTSNPGLAACYNLALRKAVARETRWLLLLDQDTEVSVEFLREALSVLDAQLDAEVVALAPKLVDDGVVGSPVFPPRFGPARAVRNELSGVSDRRLHVFNSGAVLRVAALEAIGGFPERFPLDYLDHATFTLMQKAGGRVMVLKATLKHELSSNREAGADTVAARRQEGVLDAERRFYREYGTVAERMLRRLRLLRGAAGRVLRGREHGRTWRMVKAALKP